MLTKRCRLGYAVLGGRLYVAGGYDGSAFLRTVECFDPATNRWTAVAPMHVKRSRVSLVANGGRLYAIGGYDGTSNLNTMEIYEPHTNHWTFGPSLIAHEGGVGVGVLP
jgi:kelch-like protein 18